MSDDFAAVLGNYGTAIATVKALTGNGKLKQEITLVQILTLLKLRDRLAHCLTIDDAQITPEQLERIIHLDAQLKGLANPIVDASAQQSASQFADWRSSFNPPETAWWWYLDQRTTVNPHPWEALDWLWRGLTVTGWTINISLLVDISSRFLMGGAGVAGASTIVFSSLLTLLKARSELTTAGQEGFDKLLRTLKIPQYFHDEVRVGTTLVLTLGLGGLWFSLPMIANIYNRTGMRYVAQGEIATAEQQYQRAIAIDPNNVNAHYNLGRLYEKIQEVGKARTHYLIAMQGNVIEAYNRIARLNIQGGDYPEAIALLQKALTLPQENFPEIDYQLYTYLGWARLEQEHLEEAYTNLNIAIQISHQPGVRPYIDYPASAHCLQAQVLEAQGESEKALEQWLRCCQLGNRLNPDEDTWLHWAYERLGEDKDQCAML
ncbi:tetratricopeptide repeat protein [Spirulina sp. CCNP1310]|uniref:tetratricopeptide repeat protein n=1 Tax=Spirulina sp. CCNP1310 TaxID=3110249 RepID=UPI002B215F64|nr:tetratricopeptide repeat protein [Spirulina sp. CCNP1310]MEA5418587.1 tetratricopeptide repeat protein [Spirulina sp. CCNP1310]